VNHLDLPLAKVAKYIIIHIYLFCARRCRRPGAAADVNFFENFEINIFAISLQENIFWLQSVLFSASRH